MLFVVVVCLLMFTLFVVDGRLLFVCCLMFVVRCLLFIVVGVRRLPFGCLFFVVVFVVGRCCWLVVSVCCLFCWLWSYVVVMC